MTVHGPKAAGEPLAAAARAEDLAGPRRVAEERAWDEPAPRPAPRLPVLGWLSLYAVAGIGFLALWIHRAVANPLDSLVPTVAGLAVWALISSLFLAVGRSLSRLRKWLK